MLAYFGAAACIGFFPQVRFEGSPRHWAHYLVFFLVAAWLLRTTYPRRSHWLSTVLLVGLCLVRVEAFVIATVMVSGPDYSAVTVAGYLRRPYYRPETEEFNETVVYHNRRRHFRSKDLMARAVEVARDHKRPVLIVTSQALPEPPPGFALTKLFASRRGTIDDETFTVWRFEAK
jgi:predicted membrane metal-binding protein